MTQASLEKQNRQQPIKYNTVGFSYIIEAHFIHLNQTVLELYSVSHLALLKPTQHVIHMFYFSHIMETAQLGQSLGWGRVVVCADSAL